eukprot:6479878-Amphidinium_carterae.1
MVAKKWRRFPRRRPIGCDGPWQEHDWTWQLGSLPVDLTNAWQEWEAEVEDYLCMIHDVPREQRSQYTGRAKGFSLMRRPLADVWAKHIHPRCSQTSKAWLKLEHLLADTRHGYRRVGGRHLLRRLTELTPQFEEQLQPLVLGQKFWGLAELFRYFAKCANVQAWNIRTDLQTRLKKEWATSAYQGSLKWKVWVDEKLQGGAREVHQWWHCGARKTRPPYSIHAIGGESQTALGQDWRHCDWSGKTSGKCTLMLSSLRLPICLLFGHYRSLLCAESFSTTRQTKAWEVTVGTQGVGV